MSQTLELKPLGLYTSDNNLSQVPQGALSAARNIIIGRKGITEQRRGFKGYGAVLGIADDTFTNNVFNFQNSLIIHYSNKLAYDSNNAGTWVEYAGTYVPPTGALKIHSCQNNKNFYFTTSTGIQKLSTLTGTIVPAGVSPALDGDGVTSGASGWFTNNNVVAYRVLFGYIDSNNNTVVGEPSQRIIVTNTSGGTRTVDVTFTLPSGLSTNYFYQLYRSPQSGGTSIEPNDELQLVIQGTIAGGDISAGYITVTDSTPDSLKGATIYTASSQQGITQLNSQPPIATDICSYKGYTFYSNIISKHSLNVTLISTGSPSGVQVNDTVTVAGTVYTAKAGETIANREFKAFTGGTLADDIANTAKSLVRVINRYSGNTSVYAQYASGYGDLPGRIFIFERGIGGSSFTFASSRTTAFSPSTTITSSAEVSPGTLVYSKFQQPEAVPRTVDNRLQIGAADKKILRILPLRNSLMIFKEDGIFYLIGQQAPWTLLTYDATIKLQGIENCTALNNQIYCFTNQGAGTVSEGGSFGLISEPIRKTLNILSSDQYPNFETASFCTSYESDRELVIWTVADPSDTCATQALVYNYITGQWTQWVLRHGVRAALVAERDDKMYVGVQDNSYKYLLQERKSFTKLDYADDEYAVTISASSGKIITINSTLHLEVGDTLYQVTASNGTSSSNITEITDSTHIVTADTLTWDNAPATVYKPIDVFIQTTPEHGGNPALVKKFTEMVTFFDTAVFNTLTVGVSSDFSPFAESIELTPRSFGAWGSFPYGTGANWGGGSTITQAIRTFIPKNKVYARWLTISISHKKALTVFAYEGLSLTFDSVSTRTR